MSTGEFYVRLGKPRSLTPPAPTPVYTDDFALAKTLAEVILANQIVSGDALASLYNTLRDIEAVRDDATRDLIETRLARINTNGLRQLELLIDLHNKRSDMCAHLLKEKQ